MKDSTGKCKKRCLFYKNEYQLHKNIPSEKNLHVISLVCILTFDIFYVFCRMLQDRSLFGSSSTMAGFHIEAKTMGKGARGEKIMKESSLLVKKVYFSLIDYMIS